MMTRNMLLLLCFMSLYAPILAVIPTTLINHSNRPIQLFWIDSIAKDGTMKDQSKGAMLNGTQLSFNSYEGHQFIVQLVPSVEGTATAFTKGKREETFTLIYDEDEGRLIAKRSTHLDTFIDDATSATAKCSGYVDQSYRNCMEANMPEASRIVTAGARLKTQNAAMTKKLREYLCSDPTLESSKPIETFERTLVNKNVTYNVLFDTQHAKIWTVDNFVTPEECDRLYDQTKDYFRTSTVFAANGSTVLDSARRAKDAGYPMAGGSADPLWPLYNRVIATINLKTGWKLRPAGQEGFAVIHYDPSEQYLSHCDTTCEGQEHQPRGRVATAVLYCRVAEEGGATTFTKADIFVKPRAGMATFFSYKGPDGRMDDGYTEHSGCPVIRGEKMIATAWLREGVDEQNTFHGYDAKGQKMPDAGIVIPLLSEAKAAAPADGEAPVEHSAKSEL